MTSPLDRLPPSLRARVERELLPGEEVVWAGVPGSLGEALPTLPLFVFGLGWSSISFTFAGVAVASALAEPSSKSMQPGMAAFFTLLSLPFVAVGVILLALPFYTALRAMLTAHAVTDRRLLTVTGGRWNTVEARPADTLTFLHRRDGKHGRGSLRLGLGMERDSDGDNRSIEIAWRAVPAVREAEEAIRALAARAGRTI
jgi:hypothetical protein